MATAAALLQLHRMRANAAFRALGKRLKTVRGWLLLLFTLGFFALTLGPAVWRISSGHATVATADAVRVGMPVFLTLSLVLTLLFSRSAEMALYFSPPEIDFLFSGPFTRRQLLAYRVAQTVFARAVLSLILAVPLSTVVPSATLGWLGVTLSMLFVGAIGLAAQLGRALLTAATYTTARRAAAALLVGLCLLGAWETLGGLTSARNFWLAAAYFVRSGAGTYAVAPFVPFAELAVSPGGLHALQWGAIGTGMVAAAYGVCFALDANYLQVAMDVSHRTHTRLSRMARVGGPQYLYASEDAHRRSSLRTLPFWGGMGPIGALQLLQLRRAAGGLSFFALLIAATVLGIAWLLPSESSGIFVGGATLGMLTYLPLLTSMHMPLALRADLPTLAVFKALPLRPMHIVLGQLSVVTALITLFEWGLMVVVGALVPPSTPILLVGAVLLAFFNYALFAIDTLMFLLFPFALARAANPSPGMMGRALLTLTLKVLALLALLGLAGAAAAGGWYLTETAWLPVLCATIVLGAGCIAATWAVAGAFGRIDVSTEAVG